MVLYAQRKLACGSNAARSSGALPLPPVHGTQRAGRGLQAEWHLPQPSAVNVDIRATLAETQLGVAEELTRQHDEVARKLGVARSHIDQMRSPRVLPWSISAMRVMTWNMLAGGLAADGFLVNDVLEVCMRGTSPSHPFPTP